jgi:predicted secreted protein
MNSKRKTMEFLICVLVASGFFLAPGIVAKADFTTGIPENLGPGINSPGFESAAGISTDGLSFYFGRDLVELWVSTRVTKDDPWGAAMYLGPLTPNDISMTASSIGFLATLTTADSLECYLSAQLTGGYGRRDIWCMKRETLDDAWGPLVNIGPPVNTTYDEHSACVSPDGLELYFSGRLEEGVRPGGYGYADLWVTRRATRDDPWTEPINLGLTINSAYTDARPSISPDGLLLFFDSNCPGGYGSLDLYVTRRTALSDLWGEPMNLGPLVNTAGIEECARISADGSTLYWDSPRPGGYGDNDMWQASIEPIVDLNGDGIVDCADMCIIVDNWGTDEPLCDIGPTPLGDGIVDVQDLIVLSEHLFEEYPPAESVEVNEDNNGGQFELERGQILVVTLETNPSTGYKWELDEQYESILLQLGEVEFKSSDTGDPPAVGAGGWEIFRFRAVSAGQMPLLLFYHRSWEDAEPLNTFIIQVTVN